MILINAQVLDDKTSGSIFRVNLHSIGFHFLLFTFYFTLASSAFAQDEQPRGVVAPPLKVISKEEKTQLDAQTDIKKRTVLALELMDARLIKAEGFAAKEEYDEMFSELGTFHALVDNTMEYLSKSGTNQGKVLNNLKRVEITLRKYITRLEIIRRDLPIKYEFYVRRLVKYARETRTKAIEPMFGDTVLPGNDNEK